jgi:hypothetical protein
MYLCFNDKDDGPSIEEYIKGVKDLRGKTWKFWVGMNLRGVATIWWNLLNYDKVKALPDEEYEKVFLDRWSHVGKKDKESIEGLFSCTNFLLQVHGNRKILLFL